MVRHRATSEQQRRDEELVHARPPCKARARITHRIVSAFIHPVANWIEAAKTSRSKCVTCGNVIEKGTPRLSEETREIGIPTLIHRYYHLRCALAVVPDVLRRSTPCATGSRSSPTSR